MTEPLGDIEKKIVNILSIDGGGIRGIIPATVANNIESKLDGSLAEYFDVIAGTSTGGILALGYNAPDRNGKSMYSAMDALNIYTNYGKQIFRRRPCHSFSTMCGLFGPKYPSQGIDSVMKKYYDGITMRDCITNCIITSYAITLDRPFFFKSNAAKSDPEKHDYSFELVAKSTAAAPMYFKPVCVKNSEGKTNALVDGGIVRNNPTQSAIAYAMGLYPNATEFRIVSLGTGRVVNKATNADIQKAGALYWQKNIFEYMYDGASESTHKEVLDTVNSRHQYSGSRYYRFQTLLSKDDNSALDDASQSNVNRLKDLGRKITEDQSAEIEELVELLKNDKKKLNSSRANGESAQKRGSSDQVKISGQNGSDSLEVTDMIG